ESNLTWHDAAGICAQEGGQLASIHSAAENDFVMNLASRVVNTGPGEPNVWIGWQNQWTCGVCWTDASPLDYQNWAPNYPRGVSAMQILWHGCPGYVGARGLLITDDSALRGQWVSTSACEETHAAVCKRPPTA
ncbi:C-type lectin-1, partial [Aphelenchoides avenae]